MQLRNGMENAEIRDNYAETNFTGLRKFFSDINWHEMEETNDVKKILLGLMKT